MFLFVINEELSTSWVRISATTKGQCMPSYDLFSAAVELSLLLSRLRYSPLMGFLF